MSQTHGQPPSRRRRTSSLNRGGRRNRRRGFHLSRGLRLALIDIGLICAGLLIFALFHHVIPMPYNGEIIEVARPTAKPDTTVPPSTLAPSESGAEEPAGTVAQPTLQAADPVQDQPAEVDPDDWRAKFADKFTDGEVIITEDSYRSADISIEVSRLTSTAGDVVYYVADIYIASIDNFKTGLATGEFGQSVRDSVQNIAEENGAIVAISGDYYSLRRKGVVIRNGQVLRTTANRDVGVLYYDGRFEAYPRDMFDAQEAIDAGAYQAWSFGPRLLDGGMPMYEFDSDVTPLNPRSALGYYEPGHYCFVVVDGRQEGYSIGLYMTQLSRLFYNLGCTQAYNMDGGETAQMYFGGEIRNQPYKGGRDVSDILMIVEVEK